MPGSVVMYVDIGHEVQDVTFTLPHGAILQFGCLITHSNTCIHCLRRCRYIFVDQGLAAAKVGLSDGELWSWYSRVIHYAKEAAPEADIRVVVPDAFSSLERTVALWERWAKRIEGWGGIPVLVLQEPRRIGDWVKTAAYRRAPAVAIPARELGEVKCSKRPRLCAEVAAAAIDVAALDGKWVHLLGAAHKVLQILRPRLGRDVHSFDTTSYRLAVSGDVKIRKTPDEPGLWIARPGMERQFLLKWVLRLIGGGP